MKISLNWIKEYTDIDISVDQLVQKIGRQLGAVEEVVDLGAQYQGIVVSKVVSCQKHPNADKLSVCKIDDGGKVASVERDSDGYVQVVCGAPNVAQGQTVAWLPPGVTVPVTFNKDPFVLGARELRGAVSNGMIASAQELDLYDDHSGILVIDEDVAPGTDFAEHFGLNDYVIDIENKMFTHRPDCFGILGVAREIAGIQQKAFKSPDWYLNKPDFHTSSELPLKIDNTIPELVPRFTAVAMSNVVVKASPVRMQIALRRVGLKPINNIVDMTNYIMYLTAQPLHAYDYDKVAAKSSQGAVLAVRKPLEGEEIALLNGKTIKPRSDAIMIASDKELIGVGGVMGGADTEVDEQTKNIIIECANFDMYSIRRTSMEHGLFTDAVTRFNKKQSAMQNARIVNHAMSMAQQLSGATQASEVIDNIDSNKVEVSDDSWQNSEVVITPDLVNNLLGLKLTTEDISSLLKNVEFKTNQDGEELKIQAPFWRTDIHIQEDIVEEVGRLFGFENMPLELPQRNTLPTVRNPLLYTKTDIRKKLARLGANEVLTYSFVNGDLIKKAGQDPAMAFKVTNAISPQLQYYRLSLTPSLLAHVHSNIKAGYDRFALFEINKAHNKLHANDDNGVPKEYELLSLVYADKDKNAQPAYFQAKAYLDSLANLYGVTLEYRPIETDADYPIVKPFEASRSALVFATNSNTALGIVGEFKQSVRSALKLPRVCAGFEIGIQELMTSAATPKGYQPLSRFPGVTQDICLQVPEALTYGSITKSMRDCLSQYVNQAQTYELQPIDIYSSDTIDGQKRITFRITLTNYERTLTDEVLSKILDTAADQLQQQLGAKRI